MMVLSDTNSPEFGLWSGIFSLGVGGFLPNPKLERGDDAAMRVTPTNNRNNARDGAE